MKQCTKCKQKKDRGMFSPNMSTTDGLASHCRECKAKYRAEQKAKKAKEIKFY